MIFFDTCVLLENLDIVKEQDDFIISIITLKELEEIKTNNRHDDITKFQARQALRYLVKNPNKWSAVTWEPLYDELITQYNLPKNNDSYIIISAMKTFESLPSLDHCFMTNDLSCYVIASSLGLECKFGNKKSKEEYHGYKEVKYNATQLASFYEDYLVHNINIEQLLPNEYLLIVDPLTNEVVDKYKWTGEEYQKISFVSIESSYGGVIKPKDAYQLCALDSLMNNKITLLGGKAGSGKTFFSINYLLSLYEKNKIDHIVIFCNPVVARNAAKLGFYPGSVRDKLLSTQVGQVLSSKFGSLTEVERLMDEEALILVPAGDARGYETPPRSGVYIMEAQNLDIVLMRMLLQRISDDSIVIVDGDRQEQTDLQIYSNGNNGMKRLSEVFKGQDFFGQVDLKNIYRSDIAKIADKM